MSARDDLAAFVDRIMPAGERGDMAKAMLWRRIDAYRDEYAARQVEQAARPPKRRTRARGFGGRDFSQVQKAAQEVLTRQSERGRDV